jgi:equilibrative nucleoside transporter 1/2/3
VLSAEGLDVFVPADIDLPHESSQYTVQVFLKTWKACLAIWVCYFLTFTVFPAALSGIPYQGQLGMPFLNKGAYWQVVLVMTFNVFDTAGRFLPGFIQVLSYKTSLPGAAGRAMFVGALIWAFEQWGGGLPDLVMLAVLVLFSVSNGYVTTSVMMLAPREVGLADREAAAGLLTFCLLFGMFCGTLCSLALR